MNILETVDETMKGLEKCNGGSSAYYDLPRGPDGEYPKRLDDVIAWWNDGQGMGWWQANVFKAMFRLGVKPLDPMYNWNKADWFVTTAKRHYNRIDPGNPRGPNYDSSRSDSS